MPLLLGVPAAFTGLLALYMLFCLRAPTCGEGGGAA